MLYLYLKFHLLHNKFPQPFQYCVKYYITPCKIASNFTFLAKGDNFCQIWSHCSLSTCWVQWMVVGGGGADETMRNSSKRRTKRYNSWHLIFSVPKIWLWFQCDQIGKFIKVFWQLICLQKYHIFVFWKTSPAMEKLLWLHFEIILNFFPTFGQTKC